MKHYSKASRLRRGLAALALIAAGIVGFAVMAVVDPDGSKSWLVLVFAIGSFGALVISLVFIYEVVSGNEYKGGGGSY